MTMIATRPYPYTFRAPVKGRWMGRPLLEVFLHEFSYIPPFTPPLSPSSSSFPTRREEGDIFTEGKKKEKEKKISNDTGGMAAREAATMEASAGPAATRDVRVTLPAYVQELVEGHIRLLGREEECREAGKVYQYRLQQYCAAHGPLHRRHPLSPSPSRLSNNNNNVDENDDRPCGHVGKDEWTGGSGAASPDPCRRTVSESPSISPSDILRGGKDEDSCSTAPLCPSNKSSFSSWEETIHYLHSLPSSEAASACLSALWATDDASPSSSFSGAPFVAFPSLRLLQKDILLHDVWRAEGWLFAPSSLSSHDRAMPCASSSPLGRAKADALGGAMAVADPYVLQILGCTLLPHSVLPPPLPESTSSLQPSPPVLVVYKPPGMPVHPSGRYRENTVTAILERLLCRRPSFSPPTKKAMQRGKEKVFSPLPHRSDPPISSTEEKARTTDRTTRSEAPPYRAVEHFFMSPSLSSISETTAITTETEGRPNSTADTHGDRREVGQQDDDDHASIPSTHAWSIASSAHSSLYAGYVSIYYPQSSLEVLRIWIQKEEGWATEDGTENTCCPPLPQNGHPILEEEASRTSVCPPTTTTILRVSQGIPRWLWRQWKRNVTTTFHAANDPSDKDEEEEEEKEEIQNEKKIHTPHRHLPLTPSFPSLLHVVHRLDAATSGVLLFALTAAAAREVAPLIAHKEDNAKTKTKDEGMVCTTSLSDPFVLKEDSVSPSCGGRESGWSEKVYLARVHGCFQPERLACDASPSASYCTLVPLSQRVDQCPDSILSSTTTDSFSPYAIPFSFPPKTTGEETEKERPTMSSPSKEREEKALSSAGMGSACRSLSPSLHSTPAYALRVEMPIGCASYPQALFWYPSRWTNVDVLRNETQRRTAHDDRKRAIFPSSSSSSCGSLSPTTRRKGEAKEWDTAIPTSSPSYGEDSTEPQRQSTHHTKKTTGLLDNVEKAIQEESTLCQGYDTQNTRRAKTRECSQQRALKREYMANCCRGREYGRWRTASSTVGEEETVEEEGGKREEGRDRVGMTEDMEEAVMETAKVASSMFHVCFYDAEREETVVCARLFTGRTHQLRVHLAALGHPIVGDKKYISMSKKMNATGKPKVEAHVDEERGKKWMESMDAHHTITAVPTCTAEKDTIQKAAAASRAIEEDPCRPKSERSDRRKKGNEGEEGSTSCLCPERIQLHAWQYTLHLPWKHGDRSKTVLVCSAPPPATLWYGEDD